MKQRAWLRAIAVWQISGGIFGVVVFLDAIPRLQVPSDAKWALFAPAIALCALSVLTGWALLRGYFDGSANMSDAPASRVTIHPDAVPISRGAPIVHTASGPRRTALRSLILALALVAGLPAEGGAQHSTRAAVAAPHASLGAPVGPITDLRVLSNTAPTDSARRSVTPFLVAGALAGALVGGLLAVSFHDSFCGDPAPGYTCSSTSPVAGAVIGAGVGVLAGWLLWALTRPADSPPRAGSR